MAITAAVAAAVAAALVAIVGMDDSESGVQREAALARGVCDKVASPRGSDGNRGTAARPYATVTKLANSLRPGETGCLRAATTGGG